jgi:hypothetical protein
VPRGWGEPPRVTQPRTGNVILVVSDLDVAALNDERGFRLAETWTSPRYLDLQRPSARFRLTTS